MFFPPHCNGNCLAHTFLLQSQGSFMHLLLPTISLDQLPKGGYMILWTIQYFYVVTRCGKSHPSRDRSAGPIRSCQEYRGRISQLMDRNIRRRHKRSRESNNNIGFPSNQSAGVFRFLFNLFSSSAFQKPFHFNKAILQMKKILKASYGKVSK